MTGNSTEKRPYSPWIHAGQTASYSQQARSETAAPADPGGTSGLALSAKERHALMAAGWVMASGSLRVTCTVARRALGANGVPGGKL